MLSWVKRYIINFFIEKIKHLFFETEDPVEWVEPKINPLSEPIDNLGVADVEEWNQNTHNIFQNLSEEKRVEILKLFATKD